MIIVLFIWLALLFIFFSFGYSIVRIISRITHNDDIDFIESFDYYFFFGFLVLSSFLGFLSIWVPIGNLILISVLVIALLSFILNFNVLISGYKGILASFGKLNKIELSIFILLIIFILATVVQKITLGDTESYHVQSIQWIRQYAVVPGLGNIHGRLAFNPMFFVISGLFTFQIKDILIFPLNGVCYLALISRLALLYRKYNKSGKIWVSVFYIVILMVSLLFVLPNLNSPSPDIICAVLIIYAFILLMEFYLKGQKVKNLDVILLCIVVFSCMSFKISSFFLFFAILFVLKSDFLRRSIIIIVTGILILTPFFIRNYYLSGYLIYPYPGIDIFNIDWKIPYNEVLSMKTEIGTWAKVSTISSSEVIKLHFFEWIIPWFKEINFNNKLIIIVNSLSVVSLITMIKRKDYFLAKIQLIILINLVFWFISAPDPRFTYGFLFLGFSLTIAYMVRLSDSFLSGRLIKYIPVVLICLFFVVLGGRIKAPLETLVNPSGWIMPVPFGAVTTRVYDSGFKYRVPVPEGGCYNTEIPCVPYPLKNIVLRGDDFQEGFKVVSDNENLN